MLKIKAYFIAPVRGLMGDNCDTEEKRANVERGIQIGRSIQACFPYNLELFIPHEHEVVIDRLWKNGLSSGDILTACCQIAAECDFAIVFDRDGVSDGMQQEIDCLSSLGRRIVYMDALDDEAKEAISAGILDILQTKPYSTMQ